MKETYLVHHGVKGQKWGVRRYHDNLAERRRKAVGDKVEQLQKAYKKNKMLKPELEKQTARKYKVDQSRYGRTRIGLLGDWARNTAINNVSSSILGLGALAINPFLALPVAAASMGYQVGNNVNTIVKEINNYKPRKN